VEHAGDQECEHDEQSSDEQLRFLHKKRKISE